MSVINTNVLSLVTQNNLKSSEASLNSAIQRLSSGMRINSAKDDAAGEAIANRFTANIRGLTQAQRNANDGISLAQTTEGALNSVNDNLQRIRELAVQAQNGSNSAADNASIQAEIKQRLDEIDRTSAQTDFNGVKVLASTQDLKVQVGAADGQSISIGLQKMDSTSLGMAGFSVAANSLPVGAAITAWTDKASGAPVALDMSAVATKLGVNASTLSLHNVTTSSGVATTNYVVQSGGDFYAASIGDDGKVALNAVTVNFDDAANGITTATPLASQLVKVGYDATAGAATGFVTVQGKNFQLDTTGADPLANGGAATYATSTNAVANTTWDGTTAPKTIHLSTGGTVTATTQFAGAASSNPLATIDAALKKVDDLRGALGAVQNRFDSVIANLGTTVTNLTASRSRIQDADYATEVSNMSRAQILQQAGTSVLAQANQSTQGVLSLLR